MFWIVTGGVLAAVAAVGAIVFFVSSGGGPKPAKPVNEAALVGLQSGPGPWKAEIANLAERLQTLGLPALTSEGDVLHVHQHLDIFVDGKRIPVAAGIGIDPSSFISPLHTHDSTGVIHVESPTKEDFTLGQLFAVWGVRFTPRQLGAYRAPRQSFRLYVDGTRYTKDPTKLVLASHQEIAIVVGKAPTKIPSSYRFPAGA